MSESSTEGFGKPAGKETIKPPREMSQAAIASFFYGTLQFLFTVVSSVLVLMLMQAMKLFQPSSISGANNGTDTNDVADVQKIIEELGITGPSLNPTLSPASPLPTPTTNGGTGFSLDPSPSQIVPLEFLVILLTNSFGILGLITAVIALKAATKGKSGRGLAITGLVSCFFSFGIAFMVALAV